MKGAIMKNRNWFWGIIFLLSAVFVIASQTGVFGQIGVMSISATVFLIAIVISSIVYMNFFGIFIPLPFLYMIYYKHFSLTYISPWLLILSAVLVSIGFSIIFHSHSKHRHSKKVEFSHELSEHFNDANEIVDDNNPYAKVNLSSSSRYLHSDCLKSGHFISNIGVLEVYFDQVQLSPDGAKIHIDCNTGSINYIFQNTGM
jgi:uncharacterized membrane protein